ncbi:prephenate dehydrogenase/arogenate dehydrogenase family protein [bacterium]|nr:prephenate dehydrogenase/arogenate dehydrogenase family protein [bacterium]
MKTKVKIKKISIIGVGLIGGSLGLALKKMNRKSEITGIGRHLHKLKRAKKIGAIDKYTTDFKKGVKNAELVILAVPVSLIPRLVKKLIPHFKDGCIVFDVGSVKKSVVEKIEDMFSALTKKSLFFIGVHPMAGSEKTGVENARRDLFYNAACIITPTAGTDKNALGVVKNIWNALGSRLFLMSPREHDFIVGFTSHLPHIIANCLVKEVGALAGKDKRIKKILAGSFRDMTRIAGSDEKIWADICINNQIAIIESLKSFQVYIYEMTKKIAEGKKEAVLKEFVEAKKIKAKLVDNSRL